jgi:hypothetical protein
MTLVTVVTREGPVAAIAWTGVLGFDSVIFSLTLYKAFTIGRGVRLLNVIVRDGASSSVIPWAMNLIIRVRHHVLLVRVIQSVGPLKNLNYFE